MPIYIRHDVACPAQEVKGRDELRAEAFLMPGTYLSMRLSRAVPFILTSLYGVPAVGIWRMRIAKTRSGGVPGTGSGRAWLCLAFVAPLAMG